MYMGFLFGHNDKKCGRKINCCLPQCGGQRSRDALPSEGASPDGKCGSKLLFIFLSTFFPRRKKVAKNRRSGQNLRFSPRPQLPRDARSPPIREGGLQQRVLCQPTPIIRPRGGAPWGSYRAGWQVGSWTNSSKCFFKC